MDQARYWTSSMYQNIVDRFSWSILRW